MVPSIILHTDIFAKNMYTKYVCDSKPSREEVNIGKDQLASDIRQMPLNADIPNLVLSLQMGRYIRERRGKFIWNAGSK